MIRLYINEIAKTGILNYKDPESIKHWCQTNGLSIFRDNTQQSGEYVSLALFEELYNRDQVIDLRNKFPEKWEFWINIYNRGIFLDQINAKSNFFRTNNEKHYRKNYKPSSDKTKEILNEL